MTLRLVLFAFGRALAIVLAVLLLSLAGCDSSVLPSGDYNAGALAGIVCGVFCTLAIQRAWRGRP